VKALLAAKKPLLYVGEGVFRSDACAELSKFVELAQIPVITTLKAKSAFPRTIRFSVAFGESRRKFFLNECDLLFGSVQSLAEPFSHAVPNAATRPSFSPPSTI